MPDTVEHRVEMHQLAQERRRRGQPVWQYRVTISPRFQDDELPWQDRRDMVVVALKESKWYRRQEDGIDSELWQLVEELEDVDDIETFDFIWDQVYDLADSERCWLDVWS